MKTDTNIKMKILYLRKIIQGVILLIMILHSIDSYAYVYWECGNKKLKPSNNHITMNASGISFPDNSSELGALIRGIIHWHVNPSKLTFTINTRDFSVGLSNGQSEAWASDPDNFDDLDGAKAITMWEYNCNSGEIIESDIIFNADITWTFSRTKNCHTLYGGPGTPLEGIAVHELGHALGLAHETRTYNIMYGFGHAYLSGNNVVYYPGEDAVNGAVFLMGMKFEKWQDVAAVHWKILKDLGMYRTMVYTVQPTWNAEDWPIPVENSFSVYDGFANWRDGNPNLRFNVKNGQQIWPEFTYENNGSDEYNVKVGYYLSDDDIITREDHRLGSRTINLKRDRVNTHAYGVNLPSDLIEGRDYYIGAIVDEDNQIDEFVNEENNYVAIGLHIMPVIPFSVTFSPSSIRGGESTNATVTLDGYATTDLQIPINAYPNSIVTFPTSVTIPAGQNSTTFTVNTNEIYGVGSQRVDFSASRAGVGSATGILYVQRRDVSGLRFCDVHPDAIICILLDHEDSINPFFKREYDGNDEKYIPPSKDDISDMYGDRSRR